MEDITTRILSIAGVVLGAIGTITGIASAIYARRQALAAEGPQLPTLEVDRHGWDEAYNDWYELKIIIRNKTDQPWIVKEVAVKRPKSAKIISGYDIPNDSDKPWEHKPRPLNKLDLSHLSKRTQPISQVAPTGVNPENHFHAGSHDKFWETFHIHMREKSFWRLFSSSSLSIRFTLESKADIDRMRYITLKLKLAEKTPTAQ